MGTQYSEVCRDSPTLTSNKGGKGPHYWNKSREYNSFSAMLEIECFCFLNILLQAFQTLAINGLEQIY